ncbi:hypothetical protein BKA23_2688 [Rudaeicoccus suwonensis]|uniref:Uncharacterized protein n=2 Tax=Rudaeicoccus suwonensis TaxID=657409 RepID=A0A561E3Z5_9MICO|nr:hypothetical protein BKA23_2688 [Rudaeicoccus suwonensis]
MRHGADPLRAELDSRWREYLDSAAVLPDHEEWMLRAVTEYRDEIVHLGAQELNACAVQPWNDENARLAYKRYLDAARKYDQNPDVWESAYWSALRERLPSNRPMTLE